MKKIGKAIAKKLGNKKGITITDVKALADVEEVKVEIKKQTNTVYGDRYSII